MGQAHQMGEKKEPGGMADPPQPPWKFWLRVGSAAVGVGVGWLMFPVWCLLYGNTAAGLWALFSSLPPHHPAERGPGLLLGVGGGDSCLSSHCSCQWATHEAVQRQLCDHRGVGLHVL